jgi:hypothetical protein
MPSESPVTIEIESTNIEPTSSTLPINVSISSDVFLITGFIVWFFWEKLIRSNVVKKLDGVFAPVEEQRSLNNLLAQIGVVSSASRIVLAAFHNGEIDTLGYHLTKISTINTYVAPGRSQPATCLRDLPIGRIMDELEPMFKNTSQKWFTVEYNDDLPDACKDHLLKTNTEIMHNRMVRIGNLPIGILSLQYDKGERRRFNISDKVQDDVIESLYEQICIIMRRRVIHPGPIRKAFLFLKQFNIFT